MKYKKHDFMKIGKRIKDERKTLQLSLPEMSEKIENEYGYKISRQALSDIEKGNSTRAFTVDLIDIFCEMFGCDGAYLLCEYDNCKTYNNQFIHSQTGLSDMVIKHLHEFTTYHQGKIRIAVIDYFLQDIRFTYGLTDMIDDYFSKYDRYETKKKIYFQEDEKQRKLEFDEFLTYIPVISRQKLKEYEDVKDSAHFNVQKQFDNILEDLMKELHNKYNDKTFHTD